MSKVAASKFEPVDGWQLTGGQRKGMMKAPQVGWTVAAPHFGVGSRKVRTPQSAMPGKPRGGVICRIGPQKTNCLRKKVKVKRWCKRPPAFAAMRAAW